MWEGVTVVKKHDIPKEVCQLEGRCDGHGVMQKGIRCQQGGVKGIKQECQLMERCDGHDHEGGVRECGKVRQLSGGVTVLREV